MARRLAPWHGLLDAWLAQRGHLFPWVPMCLGLGVGIYFALGWEPEAAHYAGLAAVALFGLVLIRFSGIWAPLVWALVLVALGFGVAGLRAHRVAEPVMGWRYYGPIEGRIVGMDRSASDALRLTLDRVVLADVAPARTPAHVRVSLHGQQGFVQPAPGMVVILTGHLSPPGGPVEPGGFDFQRHAWFQGLGAVGYTRTPVLALEPPGDGLWWFKARMALSARVQAGLPGEAGAFAAAIMSGDRSGMGQETLRALRLSNLAHLLAISGLHMGLLAGFVFAALRMGFALVPVLGLRVPAKKLSALGALVAAAVYLGLSGGNVATERAFVMAAVALVAVMADRRVLSLRAVAVAAVIVLVLRPEALLGPGFQMSFAATTALVAVFGWLRDAEVPLGPRWFRPVAAVVISSAVAGAATAPVAAAHFNQFAHYGLIANLMSVPLMGVLVMPAAVLAACLMPFGWEGPALWVMGLGLEWILGVAHWVSNLDGARGTVVRPDAEVLPLLALGALSVVLWQGRARWIGLAPVALSLALWMQAARPDVLIADNGSLIGVMTEKGRALNRARGSGFVAMNWLENDGAALEQEAAAALWQAGQSPVPIIALRGKRAAQGFAGCATGDWVVMNTRPENPGQFAGLPCRVLHPGTLRKTGALALYADETGIREVSARQITGARLWNDQ
ncbi:ComEC/Rec2 family competence protein [Roseovarius sp. MMSF_3281]|uniref:ComEC/Rec2 family competence protein n=1 Tax=Roseovarius sp. MMSF_3281 TaxID=3046694 RepID=UPI00273F042C|nr:ComEC/Rec2 family competence protein [Roseovarius sp. MMSF_3281]